MSCSTCAKTKPIITCGEEIIVAEGFTPSPYDVIDIYIKDITLDKTYRQKTTVNNEGQVVLDITQLPAGVFMPDHGYEIWLTNGDDSSGNHLDLIYGATTVQCLDVPFIRLYDGEAEEADSILSQEIELEL